MRADLSDEANYDRERAEEWAWRGARELGISRRRFIQLVTGAGAALVTGVAFPRSVWADHVSVVKPAPPELFINHGGNREMRWESMRGMGYLTPNDRFFVRNHSRTPHVDPATWRLRIHGSGVGGEIELSYDDILAMPSVTETKFIECAGNGRRFFELAQGRRATGTQWTLGAVGVAEWTGVRLSTVLERAGVKPAAVDVMGVGMDSLNVRRPMSIAKALDDDTLLVYGMNGQTLPEDHGFPVRLLTPGWVGISNIKWVGSIEVSEDPLFSPWNTTTYVLVGDAYPERPPIFDQHVKSALELPWPATLSAGRQTLTGRSWSGSASIAAVEVSFDAGTTWQAATLGERNLPKAWVQWSVEWDAVPGDHVIRVRATDRRGNTQPESVPFNEQGYLYWAVVDHPIRVT
jgi:sulfane dehydrogenase subunit SoxC